MTATPVTTGTATPPDSVGGATRPPRRFSLSWLGLIPFTVFATAFLLGPAAILALRSFQNRAGELTLNNYSGLFTRVVIDSYWLSIRISLASALVGGIFGFMLAWAVIHGGLPRSIRSALTTFSGVASNFAGVPLAFAFIATLGQVGIITGFLRDRGLNLYGAGFSLYSFWGLTLVYLYFQFPLMLLVITPALDGLRREWREASENLGASGWQYWRHVALPILLPSTLGTMILLFGNSFGAHATAYALTGGVLRLATITIGAQISGDVLGDPGKGYAMAMGMVVIMAISIGVYTLLQRRSERWLG
jgi:putative spermidine/putrescine transport system permease protein